MKNIFERLKAALPSLLFWAFITLVLVGFLLLCQVPLGVPAALACAVGFALWLRRVESPKPLFTLLIIAAVIAIGVGAYLGILLGTAMPGKTRILPFLGIVFWADAWGEFMAMCLRLRRGDSAFTAATGKTLQMIGGCMVGLAVVTIVSAIIGGSRLSTGFWLIELVILPCFFLAVAVVARILRGLLGHAMALEKEQEGVV